MLCRLTEKEGADNMMHSAVRPYLMDLGSANGTYLNNERIETERYYELLERVRIRAAHVNQQGIVHVSKCLHACILACLLLWKVFAGQCESMRVCQNPDWQLALYCAQHHEDMCHLWFFFGQLSFIASYKTLAVAAGLL